MVKMNWFEELVIYLIVAVIMVFFVEKIGFFIYNWWFSIIFWLILYSIISNIIIKVIRGKDEKESLKKLWEKGKTSKKVFIIIYIIVVLIFLMVVYGFVSDSLFWNGLGDNLDKDEERVKDLILDRYEIISVGIMNYTITNLTLAYVDMISLGNRNDQVFEGMSALGIIYEDASIYMVSIFEESQKCVYIIDREIYVDINDWINVIDYQIEDIENCF